jgi:hypothetical protein
MAPDPPEQHPFVAQVQAGPAEPGAGLIGLIGESDRNGKVRLYFSAKLDHYAEFDRDAVLDYTAVPPEQSALPGLQTTRVTLQRDSRIDFTYSRTRDPANEDQFDLAVRSGSGASSGIVPAATDAPAQTTQRCIRTMLIRSQSPWCPDRTMEFPSRSPGCWTLEMR